jgi:hypothetical protein
VLLPLLLRHLPSQEFLPLRQVLLGEQLALLVLPFLHRQLCRLVR